MEEGRLSLEWNRLALPIPRLHDLSLLVCQFSKSGYALLILELRTRLPRLHFQLAQRHLRQSLLLAEGAAALCSRDDGW